MAAPIGFELVRPKRGEVVILHHGNVATVLRGQRADRFSSRVEAADDASAQHLMARATGNYRRGNDRRPSP